MTKEGKFKLWSHLDGDLLKRISENPQLSGWFIELGRKGKIGSDNLLYLKDVVQHSGFEALLKDVEKYKTERELMLRSTKTTKEKTFAKQKEQAHKRLGGEFLALKRNRSAGKKRDRIKCSIANAVLMIEIKVYKCSIANAVLMIEIKVQKCSIGNAF